MLATILNPVLGLQVRLSDLVGYSGLDTIRYIFFCGLSLLICI